MIQKLWLWIVVWFRRVFFAITPVPEPVPEPEAAPAPDDETVILAMGLTPPPVESSIFVRPGRFVKPKGEKPKREPRLEREPKPKGEPKPKAPKLRGEDPEQWGQYYFRDAILDQLDVYFTYLKRMKVHDRDAYNLHSKLGIQIMPQSAVQSFDDWRQGDGEHELSAWWKSHRPGFGAVSYGLDKKSLQEERIGVADLSPEQWKQLNQTPFTKDELKATHRMATVTGGPKESLPDGYRYEVGLIWVPKFLYFTKWARVPPDVQKVTDGDVYSMTIYWDRVSGNSRGWHKRHPGGVPQDYAVCVERATGKVRVLRTLISETIKIASKKEIGGSFKIPHKRWGYPTEYVSGACGRIDVSPEDYLRRCFMEAALMYESASLGSMVRITATKGKLTATFGVEIKRMSYFFKDRDVVLNAKGSTARIFHIVRPHVRVTGKAVPMHFRGLRDFEWAGHKVHISVPGRDHFHLTEWDVGSVDESHVKDLKKVLFTGQVADRLNKYMGEGLGAWHRKSPRRETKH